MRRDPRQIFARIIRWRRFLDEPWGPIRLHRKRLECGMLLECPACGEPGENIAVVVADGLGIPVIRRCDISYRCYGCGAHFEVAE